MRIYGKKALHFLLKKKQLYSSLSKNQAQKQSRKYKIILFFLSACLVKSPLLQIQLSYLNEH